jgi:glycine cleavage system H protein
MSDVPGDLRYTKDHEWVRVEADGNLRVGITDHAQKALGELVFVETPEIGSEVTAGDACAVVESVKAASDVYSPVGGEVVGVNEALTDAPEAVNQDPYGDGWLFLIKPGNSSEVDPLLDAAKYAALLEEET